MVLPCREVLARALFRTALACSLLLAQALGLSASPAPAGAVITNVAEATYFDEATGVYETVRSNEVNLIVADVPALVLDGGTLQRLTRGARGTQHFVVYNAGNTSIDTTLEIGLGPDPAVLQAGTLYLDANRNGLVDAGEVAVGPTDPFHLQMGEELALIYAYEVSPAASAGDTVIMTLNAYPASGAFAVSVSGTSSDEGQLLVMDQTLELLKSVEQRMIGESLELTYRLQLRNDSEMAVPAYSEVDGQRITVDGASAAGVLVRDDIPIPTVFAGLDPVSGVQELVHVQGDPLHAYRSVPPSDLAEVDAVAFLLPGDYAIGRSTDVSFRVLLAAPTGSVRIDNTAATYVPNPLEPDDILSNTVSLPVSGSGMPELDFVSPSTMEPMPFGTIGQDAALTLEASGCNMTGAVDRVTLSVRSDLTGDVERVVATETGANTALFRTGPMQLASMPTAVNFDGAMATMPGDMLRATASCAGSLASAGLPVSPGAFVFDSVTNQPVGNVQVRLYDGGGAEVATSTTDGQGYFSFPELSSGTYRYELAGLDAYAFPSVRSGFWGFGRTVHGAVSYGATFAHDGGFLDIDVPVDPSPAVPLTITKSASVTEARTGGFITYTLVAENLMDQALVLARIDDLPATGLQLVPGSVRVAGAPVPDPIVTGEGFGLDLGTIAPRSSLEITYLMQVNLFSRNGGAVNSAILSGRQAGTGNALSSAPARAVVEIDNDGGALSRQATIIGSVFMDCDGDGLRDGAGEPGIPGVRIVTQQGLSVVTDIDGKYSLAGLRPRAHVLSVRANSLPKGVAVAVTRTSDLRRGGTRLVRLRAGELVSEHFAVEACSPETLRNVADRVARFSDRAPKLSDLRSELPLAGGAHDKRSVRTEAGIATATQILRRETAETETNPSTALGKTERPRTLAEIIQQMTPEPAILGIEDGAIVRRHILSVRVKGSTDLALTLSVNGEVLGAERIGERSVWEAGKVQAIEYVAVKLRAGENMLELVGRDPFGNVRERRSVRVLAPGEPRLIQIAAPETAPARPDTRIPVVVRIADAKGRTSEASGIVTLGARLGAWDVADIRPDQPGIQVYVDRGEATFDLVAPQVAGIDRLTVESSFGRAEARIAFSPDLEERIVVGVIEGAISLRGRGNLLEPGKISPFEDTVDGLSGELYLKGRIRGDALLTLRYSSDKDTQDRLFNDIRRDEFYPVYGDNAEHGYDAQSSTNLYVKVEKGQSYVLYGDIAVEPDLPYYQLGAQSRVTTGAKAHWAREDVRVTLFAAYTGQGQKVSEFPGKGISGPYPLDLGGYIEGSERVEVLVRDRDTGQVLSRSMLARYVDYSLDVFADTIVFRDPMPQADGDRHPVSVRVTYEVDEDAASRHWLYGGEVSADLSEATEAGLRIIHDAAPEGTGQRGRLAAAVIRTQIDALTSVEAEIAQSVSDELGTGSAARISLERTDDTSRLRAEASHTDTGFGPEGSHFARGTDKIAVTYDRELSDALSLVMGAEATKDRVAGSAQMKAEITARRRLNDLTESRIGLRLSRDQALDETVTSVLAGATWRAEEDSKLRFSLDIEGQLRGGNPGALEMGVEYDVSERVSFSGLARLSSDPDGHSTRLEHFRVGVEYKESEWLSGWTEMALNSQGGNSLGGTLGQGLTATWQPSQELDLRATVEHSEPLNSDSGRMTSLALGADYQSADGRWIAQGDYERLWEEARDAEYVSAGLAAQVTDAWTVLAQTRFAREEAVGEAVHLRQRTRIGTSYRPSENPRLELLAWYEQLRESRSGWRQKDDEWLVQATYEVDEDVRLNGRYSGLRSETMTTGVAATSLTQMVQGGISFDLFDEKWQLGLNGAHLWDRTGNSRSAAGIEVGYGFAEGAIVSLGYWASQGDELSSGRLHSDGVYLAARIVLDESLLDRLSGFMAR